MRNRRMLTALAMSGALLATAACSKSPADPGASQVTALLTVSPEGGATGVFVGTSVVMTFDHPLMDGMEDYMDVHEGDVTGPEVAGTCTLSQDGTTLTFTPDQDLKPATTYVIHVGGAMMDAQGDSVDLADHGMGMGGEWVTQSMMGDSTSMGGMMGGGSGSQHMGDGWWDAGNGTWGMEFSFTTAG